MNVSYKKKYTRLNICKLILYFLNLLKIYKKIGSHPSYVGSPMFWIDSAGYPSLIEPIINPNFYDLKPN
jgi:hypothetical protein